MAATSRFSDTFPIPDLESWIARATQDLRGRSLAELGWRIDDGEPLSPLATRVDRDGLAHLAAAPRSWLGTAGEPWRIRELVVAANPDDAAEQARDAITDGADEVELCFDELVRDGREPGDEAELPGVSGIAAHTLDGFRRALGDFDLAKTRLGLSAGEGATAALAMLRAVAEERGIAAASLRGDVDFDPIARLTQRQAALDDDHQETVVSRFTSVESVFDEGRALVAHCRAHCPGIRPLAIDLQDAHLSGASAATELACGLAALAETFRQLIRRGVAIDDIAAAATLRVQVGHEILIEVSKLRALRLLCARVLRAFGAGDASCSLPIHVVTSGRSRAYRFDLDTNLLRTSLAGFAAVVGGCDVLSVVPLDEDPHAQDAAMRRLARHQQLLLRSESMLDAVRDPAGGSFAIEQMTDRLARAAWREFRAIESRGGVLAALQDGSLFQQITTEAEARTRDFATRRRSMIGINRFVDARLEGQRDVGEDQERRTLEALNRLAATHAAYLRDRGEWRPSEAEDPIAAGMADALAGATTGEITRARWPEDQDFRHRFLPIALLDGDEFEELREANGDEPMRVRLVCSGAVDRAAKARLELARSVLQAGGFEIVEADLDGVEPAKTPAAARGAQWADGVDAVVVACSDEHEDLGELIGSIPGRAAVVGPPTPDLEERGIAFWQAGSTDWIDALTDLVGEGDEA